MAETRTDLVATPVAGGSPATSESSAALPPLEERPDGVCVLPAGPAGAFLGLLRAGQELSRTLDLELQAAHGIGLRTFSILLHLAAFAPDGHLRIGQLAERAALVQTPLSPSRLSRLVADLEQQGLLARNSSPGDARGVLVSITPAGRQKLAEAQVTHYRGLHQRLFSRLDQQEIDDLARITAKIVEGCGPAG